MKGFDFRAIEAHAVNLAAGIVAEAKFLTRDGSATKQVKLAWKLDQLAESARASKTIPQARAAHGLSDLASGVENLEYLAV